MGNRLRKTILATLVFALPGLSPALAAVEESTFGTLPTGETVRAFSLENEQGTRVRLCEYGALLLSVETRDRNGTRARITLSYATLDEALAGGVFGSVIGRFANRIDGGGFTIDGVRHDLESVHPRTGVHIHGGKTGFHRQLWNGRITGPSSVEFSLESPDGHEGYPGRVRVSIRYSLSADNTLRLVYSGTTDRATHLNLTNHVYFNLAGKGDLSRHELTVHSERILDCDDRRIPTGRLNPVADTPFDFRSARPLGDILPQIPGGGLDHFFVRQPDGERSAESKLPVFARLEHAPSGRVLEVATNQPGAQIYSANHFKGQPFPRWGGICFETQGHPDAPNRPEFPSTVLRPGENYRHLTEFRFSLTD